MRSVVNVMNDGRRYVACVEYDGAGYHGWQSLKSGLPTVQQHVEAALGRVANHPVSVVCSGRTDAGVHACRQIIHFDSPANRVERNWVLGANACLPDSIALRWVRPVTHDFHARFSALARRYRYVIYNTPVRSAILPGKATWNYRPLNEQLMAEAARYLVGKHDFTSYRAVQCQARNPVRTIASLDIKRLGDVLVIDIQANAFLHHMVRNIAGVLMAIGCGKREPVWAKDVLDARDRRMGGVTAPPHGLYFVDTIYPARFDLPEDAPGPGFIGPLLNP